MASCSFENTIFHSYFYFFKCTKIFLFSQFSNLLYAVLTFVAYSLWLFFPFCFLLFLLSRFWNLSLELIIFLIFFLLPFSPIFLLIFYTFFHNSLRFFSFLLRFFSQLFTCHFSFLFSFTFLFSKSVRFISHSDNYRNCSFSKYFRSENSFSFHFLNPRFLRFLRLLFL